MIVRIYNVDDKPLSSKCVGLNKELRLKSPGIIPSI